MNRFGILICLLFISFTQQIDLDIDLLYDKFAIITKGLATTDKYQCSGVLVNQKSQILPIIKGILDDLKSGKEFKDIALSHGLKLLGVEGLSDKCKVYEVVGKVLNLITEDGIKEIGYNTVNNSSDIYKLINELINAPDLDGKLEALGKILRILSGIEVL